MKFLFVTFSLLLIYDANTQINSINNERVYGGTGDEFVISYTNIPGSNDSFILAKSDSDISADKSENSRGGDDIWLLKVDINNNIIWEKTIGGSGNDFPQVGIIKDGFFYILAFSNSPISGEKTGSSITPFGIQSFWLLCLDLNGNIIWQKDYDFYGYIQPSLIELNNNNLLMGFASETADTPSLDSSFNVVLLELDPLNGDVVTSADFGGPTGDYISDIVQIPSGEIYITATSEPGTGFDKTENGYGLEDMWVLKLSENYQKLADKCFGGANYDGSYTRIAIKDNFLYFSTQSQSNISGNKTSSGYGYDDTWVIKSDLSLNPIWDKTFGGSSTDNGGLLKDANELLLSIYSYSGVSGNKTAGSFGNIDTWVVHFDENGNIFKQLTLGGGADDQGPVFLNSNLTNQNTFCGRSNSPISGIKTIARIGLHDIWLFNFNADELLSINETTIFGNINIFPNPFQDKVTFSFPEINETLHLKIFTLDGKTVYESSIEKNTLSKEVNLTDSKAIYFYEISGEKISVSGKLVKVN